MTKRQQIMDSIETLLKTVASFNARVYPWRLTNLDPADFPSVLFKDAEGKTERIAGGVLMHTLPIDIDIADKRTEVEMRDLAQEILTAFDTDDTLGGLLDSSTFTEFAMGASQMNEAVFVGHLVLSLKYETPRWQI